MTDSNSLSRDDPYFTLSKSIVLSQFDKVASLSDSVSYSSKTNQIITPILEKERDCLFSVHLEDELVHINNLSRVLFLAQGLSNEQLSNLTRKGIYRFVLDNLEDLDILLSFLKKNPSSKIELMLRVKVKENTVKTERYFVFGIPSNIVGKKILELKNHKQITSLGIHFHRKSQNVAEWNLQYELEHMFSEEVFTAIDTLNIGGGLPSVYANTNTKIFDGIFKRILLLKDFLTEKNVQLMIEPGRFIAAPAGELHSKIVLVHEQNIIVNASVYNTDMDALVVPVKLLVKGELTQNEQKVDKGVLPYVIKGKTPCSMDLFRYRVWLKEPVKGDELVFINAGAYNFSTDFCDLKKLDTRLIE